MVERTSLANSVKLIVQFCQTCLEHVKKWLNSPWRRKNQDVSATTRNRKSKTDPMCAGAVPLALAAAEDVVGIGNVGEHMGLTTEDDRLVTHYFACRNPGYAGWQWAVTVARAPRARLVTVNETVLVAGPDALRAPDWVPWHDRLRPGDLGAGHLLATPEDDERLVAGYTAGNEAPLRPEDAGAGSVSMVMREIGLGRARVLSSYGRDIAAQRWYFGEHGPYTPIARQAPGQCATCGFLILVDGPLRQSFGVCANEYSPSDGHVVSLDHGCGAHSEVAIVSAAHAAADSVVDEFQYQAVALNSDEEPEHS